MTIFQNRVALVAALLTVAGCGGGTSSTWSPASSGSSSQTEPFGMSGVLAPDSPLAAAHRAPATRSSSTTYPTNRRLLFEADHTEAAVNIYRAGALVSNPAPIATITDGIACPYGIALDTKGTLYVANGCGLYYSPNDVVEYPKGKTTPVVTITNGITTANGLAIDGEGTLFVSNAHPGAIVEYPFGSTTPSKTITGGGLTFPFGLALDKGGNLYIADFQAGQVFEVAAGTTNVVSLDLQDLAEPLGVAIDPKTGDLWVTNGQGPDVTVYPPGSTNPSQIITGFTSPYAVNIGRRGKAVVSNAVGGYPMAVYAYKPGAYVPYATLTNGISDPTGLLLAKP